MTNLFINRDLKDEIISQSRHFRGCFESKYSTKTTLCKQMFPDYHYVNLEDIAKTEIIKQNPKAFLEIHSQGLIVDEAQQYPDFTHNLNYLKNLLSEKLTSTQVIYDGEIELKSSKNGIVNFRNISF